MITIKTVTGGTLYRSNKRTIRRAVIEALSKGVILMRAKLPYVDLSDTSLQGARFYEANLEGATMDHANIHNADFSYAHMPKTSLTCAVGTGNFDEADMTDAKCASALVPHSSFCSTNLTRVSFNEANLNLCELTGANITGTRFTGAIMNGVSAKRLDFSVAQDGLASIEHTRILPQGDLIVWKRCADNLIVKLKVPKEARRSHAFGRKCRAEYAEVLGIFISDSNGKKVKTARSEHNSDVIYRVGKIMRAHQFEPDFTIECAGGIHFFLTQQEAIDYV